MHVCVTSTRRCVAGPAPQVTVDAATLERVLSELLPAKPASGVRALVAHAARSAPSQHQPGLVDFVSLLSPVCLCTRTSTRSCIYMCT